MKIKLFLLSFFLLILQGNAFANTIKSDWKKSFIFGYGSMSVNQTHTVHIADTPLPGLENGYVGNSQYRGAILLGLGLEKEFALAFKNSSGFAGFEVDYLGNKTVNGTVLPMINVSPNFDVLNYSYDVNSFVFQATAKLVKERLFYKLGGYIQTGFGLAINRLSDYYEYPPADSSAAPMLSPYGNNNTVSPTFSAGIGVNYKIGANEIAFGYRYFYTGKASLARSPVQQTNASITISPITYQFLVLSLAV